jgi:hypothetical protein
MNAACTVQGMFYKLYISIISVNFCIKQQEFERPNKNEKYDIDWGNSKLAAWELKKKYFE